jgi:hypothetical protein
MDQRAYVPGRPWPSRRDRNRKEESMQRRRVAKKRVAKKRVARRARTTRKRITRARRFNCYWIICYLPRPDLMTRVNPVLRATLVDQLMDLKVISKRVGEQILKGSTRYR